MIHEHVPHGLGDSSQEVGSPVELRTFLLSECTQPDLVDQFGGLERVIFALPRQQRPG